MKKIRLKKINIKNNKIKCFNIDKIIDKKKNIKEKLISSFIIILIICNISSILGVTFLWKTNKDYKYTLDNYGFAQGDVGKLGIEIESTFSIIRDIITATEEEDFIIEKTRLSRRLEIIKEILPKIKETCNTEEEIQGYNEIEKYFNKYNSVIEEVVKLSEEDKNNDAFNIFKVKGNVASSNIIQSINSLMELKINNAQQLADRLNNLKVVSIFSIVVFLGMGIGLTLLLSSTLSTKISDSLKKVVDISKKISEGNLEVDIEVTSNDEIGEMELAFCIMIDTLKSYIKDLSMILESMEKGDFTKSTTAEYKGNFIEMKNSIDNILQSLNNAFCEIKSATEVVNMGAEQLSQTSQSLSEGAVDQADSVIKISNNVKLINNQVNLNANNANIANKISDEFVETVERSNNEMKSMVASMDNIEECSKNISNIIKDINNIAEKTNLLALNAAIEAARAGEAGKGFAVVAGEVTNLANMSATAAKKTNILIEETINAVNEGKNIANNTAQNLLEVVDKVKESNELIKNIAIASNEQSSGIEKMSIEIDKISQIVQSNSAISEQSAAYSEELMGESNTLANLLKKITIKKWKD